MSATTEKDREVSTNPDVEWEQFEKFLGKFLAKQKPARLRILNDIFKACWKLTQESTGTLNLKITSTVLKELRYSFKMFYPHRMTPKITMFGSARVEPDTALYDFAKGFAKEAVKKKFLIMTGGGPGIMAAGNEGAETTQGFGLNIRLPVEQSANPFIDKEKMLIHYKYFFTRKLFLVKEAQAFAFFPGGFGTFDEAFEVLTLLQTGKSNMIPVVLMEPKGLGFWKHFTTFVDEAFVKKGFISESDKHLYHVFNEASAAIAHIELFYKNFHSLRMVKGNISIRLKKKLTDTALQKLNHRFSPLLAGDEKIVQGGALTEENNEPELANMSRLIFPFVRHDYGSLRHLIDFINQNTV